MRDNPVFGPRRPWMLLIVLGLLWALPPAVVTAESWAADPQTVENLEAFARLYGVLRWFHPSDQAASADWSLAATQGVLDIATANTSEQLAQRLQTFFADAAPTLRVFPADQAVAVPAELALPAEATRVSVRTWNHSGLGTKYSESLGGIYWSMRSSDSLSTTDHDPERPLRIQLSDGVAAWVATALYADPGGTIPQETGRPAAVFAESKSPDGMAMMLADAIVIWNLMAHFYPYFDVVAVDWDDVLTSTLRRILEAGETYSEEDLESDLLVPLVDGHANIRASGGLASPAIPDLSLAWVEGKLIVAASAGEARAAGIRPGDEVLRIDGSDAASVLNAKMRNYSGSMERRRAVALLYLLLGERGTQVDLTIASLGGSTHSLSLERTRSTPLVARTLDPVEEIEPGILYVDVTRASTSFLGAATRQIEQADGIIIDSRGYPLNRTWATFFATADLASMRLRTPLYSLPFQEGVAFRDDTTTIHRRISDTEGPELIFLIDARAISAAEHQLSYFAQAGIGTFIGAPTAGANGNINRLILPSGNTVTWTGMIAEWADGECFHSFGIQPDMRMGPTRQGLAEGRDDVLEEAQRVLKALLENN